MKKLRLNSAKLETTVHWAHDYGALSDFFMKKLVLKCYLSPGDIVMLTAAVRDLQRCYPGEFLTDVRTHCKDLWENNPNITPLDESDPGVEVIDCSYPLINRCDTTAFHCLQGFVHFLNERLGLEIELSAFKGDIHLSEQEKAWYSQVHEVTRGDTPFWIVDAGGKYDVTIKWWSEVRFQQVVDHFKHKVLFVQVGRRGHHHPRLNNVIDLRGQTTLRELIRLVYHSQGILSPVTCVMHLAAAVEVKREPTGLRPCVVVAGGREPTHWEAYPGHQFVHTIGALQCCARGGCWRDRVFPLGDGDERDEPTHLCLDVVRHMPRCMDMISSHEVIRRIETYYQGGVLAYLTKAQQKEARVGVRATVKNPFDQAPLPLSEARMASWSAIERIPAYPGGYRGRGIVICAGGAQHFTNAWVCINRLRALNCTLPVELWFIGKNEVDQKMKDLLEPFNVRLVDAEIVRKRNPYRRLGGWELKPFAIVQSRLKEVLFLDADNVPVCNPEFLFDSAEYLETGALFWPDHGRFDRTKIIWDVLECEQPDEPEFESGQMVIDKKRCWRALQFCLWINENSDLFYRYLYGDKDSFHIAFRRLNQAYHLIQTPVHSLEGTMCQHDPQGNRLFQHRNSDKWSLFGTNRRVADFQCERECRDYLAQLKSSWNGYVEAPEIKRYFRKPTASAATHSETTIVVGILTCSERDRLLRRTKTDLSKTDWDPNAIFVQCDDGEGDDRVSRQVQNAKRLLQRFLSNHGDYLLFLEDDVEFNRYLRHNLRVWLRRQRVPIALAGLYNPGLKYYGCDFGSNSYLVQARAIYGSQALLIARSAAEQIVNRWDEVPGKQDIKISRLAGHVSPPIRYHVPSLVQHVGGESTWGGTFHEAKDFDRHWKASLP